MTIMQKMRIEEMLSSVCNKHDRVFARYERAVYDEKDDAKADKLNAYCEGLANYIRGVSDVLRALGYGYEAQEDEYGEVNFYLTEMKEI